MAEGQGPMTSIKELISIPECVHQDDFVPKLAEGVNHPEETLRDDVVTPLLADALDNAFNFIAEVVRSGDSKAAHLDGGSGAGKKVVLA